jgi:hypothetical protein
LLGGCLPSPTGGSDDERNPHVLEARARRAAYNYPGAKASLEKALETNPRLAIAHWELALLQYEKLNDYASAYYHFDRVVKLRPEWPQSQSAKQFMEICELELAKAAPPIPQTPQIQRLIDSLTTRQIELSERTNQLEQEVKSLKERNQQLAADNARLKQWVSVTAAQAATAAAPAGVSGQSAPRPGTLLSSNVALPQPKAAVGNLQPRDQTALGLLRANATSSARPQGVSPAGRGGPAGASPGAAVGRAPAPKAARTHTVRYGETLASIARRYGLGLDSLLAANPGVRPERLKVGQAINLPAR